MAPALAAALLAAALAATEPAGALAALAARVAEQLGPPAEGRRALALAVDATPPALGPPAEAALLAALGREGWSSAALAPGAEATARSGGADWLLRLSIGASEDRRDLLALGEATPRWASFFLQARPGVPPAPPRPISARVASDEPSRLVLAPPRAPALSRLSLRRLASVPGRVLAVAAGLAGAQDERPVVVAVLADEVRLLDATGRALATLPLAPAARREIRWPAATAAIGPFGAGRIALALAGEPGGRLLSWRGGRLEAAGALDGAPLAAGPAGVLTGAFTPGEGELEDRLALAGAGAPAAWRAPGPLAEVTAASHPGRIAFAARSPAGRLDLLGPSLAPAGALDGIGAGALLADLLGDGAIEVIASSTDPGPPDRLRVLPAAGGPPAWASTPIAGAVTGGAAADLTGDGRDDGLLAIAVVAADGTPATELWLLTADPREAP